MNTSMMLLYNFMLDDESIPMCITTEDDHFFLLVDFYDGSNTSIGFYEQNGKIGIRSFVRIKNERRLNDIV